MKQQGNSWILPNLSGYDIRSVSTILEPGKMRLVPEGSGISYQQSPPPGSALAGRKAAQVKVWFH
jgi:cell division protein FtsI (penicillin-binding protein 3)/stage V sporulation protein D (sporulation-specific penicillin-binding protein)